MGRRQLACAEVYKRIKDSRKLIGLKSFKKLTTVRAKIEEAPICFMSYGSDNIIKRSSRTSAISRPGEGSTRSLEIFLELVCPSNIDIEEICAKIRKVILADPHPIQNTDGKKDKTTFLLEDRTEGPTGYGIPEVTAMILVITVIYIDES